MAPASAKEAAFKQWLLDHGASLDCVDWPVALGNSRGVVCTRDVEPLEAFFTVPEKLLLTTAKAIEALPDLADAKFVDRDHVVLSIFLMHERAQGEASFWHPYISTLPEEPDGLMLWSAEECAALHDDELVREARMLEKQLEKGFAQLQAAFPKLVEGKAFEEYRWASMTVASRVFGRRLTSAALVPLADLLNHASVQTKYELEDGEFRLFPTGKYRPRKGEEAFNSYGRVPSRELLLHYGFALKNNAWDFVRMKLVVGDKVPLASRKREVFAQSGLQSPWDLFAIPVPPEPLVRFFRLVALSQEELEEVKKHPRGVGNALAKLISLSNEVKALQAAISSVQMLVTPLPTREKDDLKLLEAHSDSPTRLRSALFYRISRKRIIRFCVQYLRLLCTIVERMLAMELSLKPALDMYPKAQALVLKAVYHVDNFEVEKSIDVDPMLDELGL